MSANEITFKLKFSIIFMLSFFCHNIFANNVYYVTLSGNVARHKEMVVIANNVANSETIGYEREDVLFGKVALPGGNKKNNDYVYFKKTYESGDTAGIKLTNQPLDLAIIGPGYFKIRTPRGIRYTLEGSYFVSPEGQLLNKNGYNLLDQNDGAIEVPLDATEVYVAKNGDLVAGADIIATIGIFDFPRERKLTKEGNNMLMANMPSFLVELPDVLSGALRESNVSSVKEMSRLIENERAIGASVNVMNNIAELERSVITKMNVR